MYSRKTYGGQFRIPEHYSGTAFDNYVEEKHIGERRDAVGRLSALPEQEALRTQKEHHPPPRKKAPPPILQKQNEEEEKHNEPGEDSHKIREDPEKGERQLNDDVMIGALLLSLIGSRGDKSDDIMLIILALLLIL